MRTARWETWCELHLGFPAKVRWGYMASLLGLCVVRIDCRTPRSLPARSDHDLFEIVVISNCTAAS